MVIDTKTYLNKIVRSIFTMTIKMLTQNVNKYRYYLNRIYAIYSLIKIPRKLKNPLCLNFLVLKIRRVVWLYNGAH